VRGAVAPAPVVLDYGFILSLLTSHVLPALPALTPCPFSDRVPVSLSLTWRNRQTRTAQDRMGQPVEVRVLS
jgi:hypothetical protein